MVANRKYYDFWHIRLKYPLVTIFLSLTIHQIKKGNQLCLHNQLKKQQALLQPVH